MNRSDRVQFSSYLRIKREQNFYEANSCRNDADQEGRRQVKEACASRIPQASPRLAAWQKGWARDESLRFRRGIQGERDAAYYLDNYLADTRDYAVLHDLRLELGGETAQIDRLFISRTYSFYMLETKNFSGNLKINEQREFSVGYQGEREFGVPSPLEQNHRHVSSNQ